MTREEEDFGPEDGGEQECGSCPPRPPAPPPPPLTWATKRWPRGSCRKKAEVDPSLGSHHLASEQRSVHRVPEPLGSRLRRSCASLVGSWVQEASSLTLNRAVRVCGVGGLKGRAMAPAVKEPSARGWELTPVHFWFLFL